MATYYYRCTRRGGRPGQFSCGHRETLSVRYHDGDSKLTCPVCGGKMKLDKTRKKERANEEHCYCSGLHFSMRGSPHRKGSKGCQHYEGDLTDEDYEDQRAQLLKVQRGE